MAAAVKARGIVFLALLAMRDPANTLVKIRHTFVRLSRPVALGRSDGPGIPPICLTSDGDVAKLFEPTSVSSE